MRLFYILLLIQFRSVAQIDLAWAKSMGGGLTDFATSSVVDNLGNIFTTGTFAGTVDFDPGSGVANLTSLNNSSDVFISKLDAEGNYMWTKQLGGNLYDEGRSIEIDSFGNIFLTGNFSDTVDFDPSNGTFNLSSSGETDVFIVKLDSSGDLLWAKSVGGVSYDWGYSLSTDNSGNVYVTGAFRETVDFDANTGSFDLASPGYLDIFLTKYNGSGNFVWARQIGGQADDRASAIEISNTGEIYLTGYFNHTVDFDPNVGVNNLTSSGDLDIFISKYDNNSNLIWAKQIGGSSDNSALSLAIDEFGNVYTTGQFWGTSDFDPGPNISSLTSSGSFDVFILKLDSYGNFAWAKTLDGPAVGEGYDIQVDKLSNVYVSGWFWGTFDFDSGISQYNLTSEQYDIFILKLDGSGNFKWAEKFGSVSDDVCFSINIDDFGSIYIVGLFENAVDFDPQSNVFNLNSEGHYDIFVVKYNPTNVSVDEKIIQSKIDLFPNPSSGLVSIKFDGVSKAKIFIYDNLNNCLLSTNESLLNNTTIDLSSFPKGIYFIELVTDKECLIKKMILN